MKIYRKIFNVIIWPMAFVASVPWGFINSDLIYFHASFVFGALFLMIVNHTIDELSQK